MKNYSISSTKMTRQLKSDKMMINKAHFKF